MKRIWMAMTAVLLVACMLTASCAETYRIEAIETDLELPTGISVAEDLSTDEMVLLQMTMSGREDTAFQMSISYAEGYEGYTTGTLTDDMRKELNEYYGTLLTNSEDFEQMPWYGEDDEAAAYNPLMKYGKDHDGNLTMLYLMVVDGFIMTVSITTSAEEFDEENSTLYFDLVDQCFSLF